ncbi:uncharacterized protein LOC111643345 [Copidosoma floridanum]|uniref:uncharacterized protein LOC111643345 n=1 Tax=Copidosoma floridanum TaxID=29053 RepID=UPI000C6FCC0B|nr:uncharacterized protein LOC111643345 [Copidosoma floridanum]
MVAKQKKENVGAIFLDIKGVYDNVNIEILVDVLRKARLPPQTIQFVKNITLNRKIQFYYQGVEEGKGTANKSLPKGSILSPILFNIYLAERNRVLDYRCSNIEIRLDSSTLNNSEEVKYLGVGQTCECACVVWCEESGRTIFSDGVRLGDESTIFDVEALAVARALKFAKKNKINKFKIFSDSRAVLQYLATLGPQSHMHPLIGEARGVIQGLREEGREFKLIWIPSHKGIKENDSADRHVKIRSLSPQIGFKGVYWKNSKKKFKQIFMNNMRRYINKYGKAVRFVMLSGDFSRLPGLPQ